MQNVLIKALTPVLLALTSVTMAAEAAGKWSYEGDTGPDHWGTIDPAFSTCASGKNQSPINIDPATNVMNTKLPGIQFNYSMLVPDNIHNIGTSIGVDLRSGGEIELDGEKFTLKQLNFHTPSETHIEGKSFPMEIHFVNKNEKGEIAVVAMLLSPGAPHPGIDRLWRSLPKKVGTAVKLENKDLEAFETDQKVTFYYRYNGSLTTPPCTEGVRWIVLRSPVTVAKYQVDALQRILKKPNARPVQPIHARQVLE